MLVFSSNLVEMRGVGPHVLANTEIPAVQSYGTGIQYSFSYIPHGVGDDVALHDHNSIFGHVAEMRLAVMSAKQTSARDSHMRWFDVCWPQGDIVALVAHRPRFDDSSSDN